MESLNAKLLEFKKMERSFNALMIPAAASSLTIRTNTAPGPESPSPRHSEFHMQDDARVFLGQHNFPVTHLLRRTSRVITCTNCSLLRRATAILGATGETGQLMARRPLSAALCIIPQPTLWRTLPSCADVCIINHISYQMHIPSHKYSLPNL